MLNALRVVQVSFHADREQRDAETLLRAWPTLSSVAASVARAGVDVTVVQTAHADETIRRDGVTFHFVSANGRHATRVIDRVVAGAPDVVHVHGFHHSLIVRRLARAVRGTPVLLQDHGGVPPTGLRRVVWRWALRPLAATAFTSPEQVAPWIGSGVLQPDRPVFGVLGGSSWFEPGDQSEARRVTGMFGEPCLLWTGRLDANKDPLMMLDAVERAAEWLPGLRLWCCFGDAPMLAVVMARIDRSPVLRARTVLIGSRPHDGMEVYYRAADFYLQASHREGSGFSLLEAMSCGTPPLVTDIPAARRIVGDAGSLTPVGDVSALAAAIVDWAARDATDLRRTVRARFDNALTFDVIGRELRAAYDALAAR